MKRNTRSSQNEEVRSHKPPRYPLQNPRSNHHRGTISHKNILSDSLRPLHTPHCSNQNISSARRKYHSTAVPRNRKRSKSETRTKPSLISTPLWMERNTSVQWNNRPSSCETVNTYTDIKNKDAWEQLKIFQKKYLEGEKEFIEQKPFKNGYNYDVNTQLVSNISYDASLWNENTECNVNETISSFYQDKDLSRKSNHRISGTSSRYKKSFDKECSNETMKATEDIQNRYIFDVIPLFDSDRTSYKDDGGLTYSKKEENKLESFSNPKAFEISQTSDTESSKYLSKPNLVFPDPPIESKTPSSFSNSRSSSTSNGRKPMSNRTLYNNESYSYKKSNVEKHDSNANRSYDSRGRSRSCAVKNKCNNMNIRNKQLPPRSRRIKGYSLACAVSSHDSMPILQDSLPIIKPKYQEELTKSRNDSHHDDYDASTVIYPRSHSQPPRY